MTREEYMLLGPMRLIQECERLEREKAEAVAFHRAEMRLVADGLEDGLNYATKLGEKYTNDHAVGYLQSVIGSWLPRLRGELEVLKTVPSQVTEEKP